MSDSHDPGPEAPAPRSRRGGLSLPTAQDRPLPTPRRSHGARIALGVDEPRARRHRACNRCGWNAVFPPARTAAHRRTRRHTKRWAISTASATIDSSVSPTPPRRHGRTADPTKAPSIAAPSPNVRRASSRIDTRSMSRRPSSCALVRDQHAQMLGLSVAHSALTSSRPPTVAVQFSARCRRYARARVGRSDPHPRRTISSGSDTWPAWRVT